MIVRISRARLLAALAGLTAATYILHTWAGLAYLNGERHAFQLWVTSLIFGGLTAILVAKILFSRLDRAHITPAGLLAPDYSKSVIPWCDIQSVSVTESHGTEQAMIELVPGAKSEANFSTTAAISALAGRALGMKGYAIPLAFTGVSGQDFLAAVEVARAGTAAARETRRPDHVAMRMPARGTVVRSNSAFGRRASN